MHIDLFKTNGSSPPSKTQLSDMFFVHRFERLAIFPVLEGNPHSLLHEPRFVLLEPTGVGQRNVSEILIPFSVI